MKTQIYMALSLLNELKAAAFDSLQKKQRGPGLLLLYSFSDICASLANSDPNTKLPDRFKNYLQTHALCRWTTYTSQDLWAARCSLLHAYSPNGNHTNRANGAKAIFYYAWPENREAFKELLESRGHQNFWLVDVQDIKSIAVTAYNSLFIRLEEDPEREATIVSNAAQLLRMTDDIRVEQLLEWVNAVDPHGD